MIFALTNSKGGVGKSTISVHLTVWLHERGAKVALVDGDVQGSSSTWLREAAPEIESVQIHLSDNLMDLVPSLQKESEHLIIDCPSGLSETTPSALCVADVVLIPCLPSVLDLQAVRQDFRAIYRAQAMRGGLPRVVLVPNRMEAWDRLGLKPSGTVRALEIPTASGLRSRKAYMEAARQGTVVWRMGQRAQVAAREMEGLLREILANELAP